VTAPPSLPPALERGLVTFGEAGRAWVAELPARLERLRSRWALGLGPPFRPGGVTSWVAPATRPDGSTAVLKVVVPHPEAEHEAAALRVWAGDGAVRLLDEAPEEHALLLERCRSGTALAAAGMPDDEALATAVAVGRRLWRTVPPGSPFAELGDVTSGWAALVEERAALVTVPLPPDLVALGARLLRDLPATASAHVLLHGDLHPANLLAAEREPWLAIDAKPMGGDPAFDPAPIVLQTGDLLAAADPAGQLARRLRLVAAATGLDPARLRDWALARSVEMAVWSVARGDPDGPATAAAWARLLAEARI